MSCVNLDQHVRAGKHSDIRQHFTMVGIGKSQVIITENDVPGAKLTYENLSLHTVVQLKRWLECRGLSRSGLKPDLVKRVDDCISAGQSQYLDESVDGGKWLQQTASTSTSSTTQQPPEVPILPITGWKPFPSVQIPCNFNEGHIYHHIVESVQNVDINLQYDCNSDSDADDDENEDDAKDLHTSKPLRKGKIYFTSGHVNSIKDQRSQDFYFVKCKVMSSYKPNISYDVTCTMSTVTGFIKDSSCHCKASAMGRCNHVSGLLFAILDYVTKHGPDPTACTSTQQTWNMGRKKKKNPQPLHKAVYNSYKRRKIDNAYDFDPRPPSLRVPPTQQQLNTYVSSLQADAGSNYNGELCMAASIIQIKYDNYDLTQDDQSLLSSRCSQLRQNINVGNSPHPVEVCKDQKSSTWYLHRRVRVTASECYKICHLKSKTAATTFIYNKLWGDHSSVTSYAIDYGNTNESKARQQYLADSKRHLPSYNVISTGLWMSSQNPELACSPDGLVLDPSLQGHDLGQYGLIEIKCPQMLEGKNVKEFDTLLSKHQLSYFCLSKVNRNIFLKRNHMYYYQIQMQLGVTGLKWCDFIVWSSIDYFVERVEFDPDLWTQVKSKLVTFHHRELCPEFFEMRTPRQLSHYICT